METLSDFFFNLYFIEISKMLTKVHCIDLSGKLEISIYILNRHLKLTIQTDVCVCVCTGHETPNITGQELNH